MITLLARGWPVLYWVPAAVLLTDFYTLKQVSGRSMQVRAVSPVALSS